MAADGTRPATGAGAAHVHATAVAPDPSPPVSRPSLVQRFQALLGWWKHSRAGGPTRGSAPAAVECSDRRHRLSALSSVFAALTISYTVFHGRPGRQRRAAARRCSTAVDAMSPPVLPHRRRRPGRSTRSRSKNSPPAGSTITGIVAVVVLLISAIAVMAAFAHGRARDVRRRAPGREPGARQGPRARGARGAWGTAILLSASECTTGGGRRPRSVGAGRARLGRG